MRTQERIVEATTANAQPTPKPRSKSNRPELEPSLPDSDGLERQGRQGRQNKQARRESKEDGHPKDSLARAIRAVEAALDKKALEPVLLDVHDLASYTDYILILSGRSDRHVEAIGEGIVASLTEGGTRPLGVEGTGSKRWTLVDFGDVIVHVFHHPLREYYDLESLWVDAPRISIAIPEDARIAPGEMY
ncbi:MAG: ribosome silencing factor [Pseudomonadota bacterium]